MQDCSPCFVEAEQRSTRLHHVPWFFSERRGQQDPTARFAIYIGDGLPLESAKLVDRSNEGNRKRTYSL